MSPRALNFFPPFFDKLGFWNFIFHLWEGTVLGSFSQGTSESSTGKRKFQEWCLGFPSPSEVSEVLNRYKTGETVLFANQQPDRHVIFHHNVSLLR